MSEFSDLNWLRKIQYGICSIKVRQDIFAARYEQAMAGVEKLFSICGEEKPSQNVKIQLNLVYGMVAWNLGRYNDVYWACRVALDQITRKLRLEKRPSRAEELKYLRAYCKTLVGFADQRGGDRKIYYFDEIDQLRSPDYNLAKISEFLKQTFPVGDTSWW